MDFRQFCRKYPAHQEEAIERAGIMEYDGNRDRMAAEVLTVQMMIEKYGLQGDADVQRERRDQETLRDADQMPLQF